MPRYDPYMTTIKNCKSLPVRYSEAGPVVFDRHVQHKHGREKTFIFDIEWICSIVFSTKTSRVLFIVVIKKYLKDKQRGELTADV
jgi:hypothetical protein